MENNNIFVIKLGPLYQTNDPAKPWTSDPAEAVRMTFDTAQMVKETEYLDIAVHPSEQVTYIVEFGHEGGTIKTKELKDAFLTAIDKSLDDPSLEFTIKVADVFLNQDGLSKEAKAWKF